MTEKQETPFVDDDSIYSKPTKSVPRPDKNIGVDTHDTLIGSIEIAGESSTLDMSALESFLNVSRSRNEVYRLLDSMGEDSQIASILEAYAGDATEYNSSGRIVWAESSKPEVAKFVTYLLDTINVDKNIYNWAYSLCKYGDLYLRLYRESDYKDPVFGKETKKKSLTESSSKDVLDESVKVIAHERGDKYSHYVERVANPADMFELTKHGKTYGYIKADTGVISEQKNNLQYQWYQYKFKQQDVEVYGPTEFVHACLEGDVGRTEEEVTISLDKQDNDGTDGDYTYKVKRGQSILYSAFKVWRELMLLENSVLLNRVTKSSILRAIGVEVGDMPKERVQSHLANVKSLIEQKSSINAGVSMNEYNSPGPVENCIYMPTRNGQGAITVTQIGGDVDVKSLADLEYFRDKLYGALRSVKQYFGFTDDAAGFNGGSSMAQLSIPYAKAVKRIQNVLVQAITDMINLMLIDKGLDTYINDFTIKMLPPMTQAEVDRQSNTNTQIGIIRDVMQLVSESGVESSTIKLQILKLLLSTVVTEPKVVELIQEEIDNLESEEEDSDKDEETKETDEFDSIGIGRELEREPVEIQDRQENPLQPSEDEEDTPDVETVQKLPSPQELNAGDFTDSDNPEFI